MDVRYLILSLTTRCNLNCVYCYNGGERKKADMSEAVLKQALALIAEGERSFHLQLTGGEPTLVPDLIEAAVLGAKALERPCSIGLQTNGTLLTPGLAKFLKYAGVQAGVSLDGPPSMQNALRGQAGDTLRGLRLLDDHGVPFRVTTVVSENNAPFLEHLVYVLATFANARGIGLDLLTDKGRAKGSDVVLPASPRSLREGAKSMLKALNAVNSRRQVPLEFRELNLLKRAAEGKMGEPRAFCRACLGQSAAIHPDGRLYPCGQTMGDPLFEAGSVWAPAAGKLKIASVLRLSSENCGECPLKDICPGECPSRLHYNRTGNPGLACELYRVLWSLTT